MIDKATAMKIDLTKTQVELLTEIIFEEIRRVQESNMQYRGQIVASLKSIEDKLKAEK